MHTCPTIHTYTCFVGTLGTQAGPEQGRFTDNVLHASRHSFCMYLQLRLPVCTLCALLFILFRSWLRYRNAHILMKILVGLEVL